MTEDRTATPRGEALIVMAGCLFVSADARDHYLQGCRAVVEQARTSDGCLDVALSPDLVDERRINVHERWATREDLLSRGSGPCEEQSDALRGADGQES